MGLRLGDALNMLRVSYMLSVYVLQFLEVLHMLIVRIFSTCFGNYVNLVNREIWDRDLRF